MLREKVQMVWGMGEMMKGGVMGEMMKGKGGGHLHWHVWVKTGR